jgi:hypothetical protein
MTKRTRLFVVGAATILVLGLGTGLVASYMGFQNLVLIGGDGPAELAYVPTDSKMVGFVNVRDVMDSELRQKLMQQLQPGGMDGADKFQAETGIDIRTDVDQVVASIAADSPQNVPLLLVRGRFDTARIESLIRTKGGTVEDYQGHRLLSLPEAEGSAGLAFIEPGLAAVGSLIAVRRAIDTKAGGNDVTDNSEIMRLVRDIDDGNAWMVARFDALSAGPIPSDVARQLPPINWFAANAFINGGVRAVIHAEAHDEAAANNLRDVIQGFVALARLQLGQRAELADLLNSFELGGQGKTVSLGFAVPADVIETLGAIRAGRPGAERAPNAPRTEQPAPPSL